MSFLTEERIRALLRKYSITPEKSLGQSFLINPTVARKTVESANIDSSSRVLEIGGGFGMLSEKLAERADRVYVIEIDKKLVLALREILSEYSNVEIIHGDALTMDLPEVDRVVSNLPYSISSPITFRLLEEARFQFAILMYQYEFAQRLVAEPGSSNYSRLSVDIQYLARVREIMHVPASDFYPVPAVDSMVVRVDRRRDGPFAQDKSIVFWLVHGIYSYPNKVLRKALRIWFKNLGQERRLVDEVIERAGSSVEGAERLRTLDQKRIVILADTLLEMIEEGKLADPRGTSS
ncbi:MAG: 16S rRNA (adenine(1518)-N(6)/adenine(1519)-N(6))-dimethyltransferase RsmA [Candidatus Thorarchaeota archaeon]